MPVNLRDPPGRFRPEALFRPASLALIGTERPARDQVMGNLQRAGYAGRVMLADGAAAIAALPETPDLAVLCDAAPEVGSVFAALGARGCFAAVVTGMSADGRAGGVREAARATRVRALGPGSFGVAVPAIGLDATRGHLRPLPGRLALVSQSAALCRAVLDWAAPNGVGFSHIVGVGGNEDIGFARVLDWLARDTGTAAILLDIRKVKSARLFLSAARAAAQVRPVVAIRAGLRLIDPEGDADAAFEAALHRAGVLSVTTLEELLAAAETLTRARPLRGAGLAIATNAIGPAQLAADAAVREHVPLAALGQATREVLRLALPGAFATRGGADVPESVGDMVYCGLDTPIRLGEAAALLAGAPEVGGVLVVHAPTGEGDAAGMEAIAAASSSIRQPLLVCAMGETTGAVHRRRLAEAGLAVFATPEQAVRGFAHLVRHARIRELARELPPRAVMRLDPDRGAVEAVLAAARAAGRLDLSEAEAAPVLAAYRIAAPAEGAAELPGELRLSLGEDGMFGPTIAIGRGGAAGAALRDLAIDLPPLNLTLARAQFARSRMAAALPEAATEAAAATLVRASQLAVDFPEIATLVIDPLRLRAAEADQPAASAGGIALRLRPQGAAPARLAIPPYPAELAETLESRGERLTIRPIRPEDAAAHGEFFRRLSPQDIRYRFFSALRELSREQLARMTQVDFDREMAFIAVREVPGGPAETVGVARLVRETGAEAGPGAAHAGGTGEFAIIVQPDMRGRGVAAVLMHKLIAWGRAQGLGSMVGQVLADNAPMLGFMRRLGFKIRRMPGEPDVVEAWMPLDTAEGEDS